QAMRVIEGEIGIQKVPSLLSGRTHCMSLPGFRIRTPMIAVAVIAVSIGVILGAENSDPHPGGISVMLHPGFRPEEPAVTLEAPGVACPGGARPMNEMTYLLSAIEHGEPRAAEQLLPLVYDELRRLAAHWLAHEKPGLTLQATALVHEAYVRLVDSEA